MEQQPHPLSDATANESAPTDSSEITSSTDPAPTDSNAETAPQDPGSQPPIAEVDNPMYERRRQRILDYGTEHLADENSQIACLGAVNVDLLELQIQVGETLREGFSESGPLVDKFEQYSKLIDSNSRLTKQIAHLFQLELKLRGDEERRAALATQVADQANKMEFCAPMNPR